MFDHLSLKPSRKVVIFIGSIAIVCAVIVGLWNHSSEKGVNTYLTVVNYLSKPIFNWMGHRVDRAMDIINQKR